MNGETCLLCGSPAVHEHHVTGRSSPGEPYFDALLTVDLDQRCHIAEHQVLRRLGLAWPAPGGDLLVHRLVRLGAFANHAADLDRGFVLDVRSTSALAVLIFEAAKVLDTSQGGSE